MSNRFKVYFALIAAPIIILFFSFVAAFFLYDLSSLTSNPKQFVNTNFPSFYYKLKKVALRAGGENIAAGERLKVPQIYLKLSRNDQAHFSDLAQKFNDPDFGVVYYSKNNQWRKAKLEFEDRKYNVKIKAHGTNPTDHQEGDFISFAVKMPKGERVMGANTFSLIVRSRIYTNRLLITQLAERLNLINLSDDLVRVKINGQPEKYFFLEKKFDNKFMEIDGKSSFRRIQHRYSMYQSADKSLVKATDTEPYTEKELIDYLRAGLIAEGVPETHFEHIISRYVAINKAITLRSPDVRRFFDPDYIAKYDALAFIMGFVGHSWMKHNFFVYYNQADGLFYPSVTRDSVPSKLSYGSDTLEKQLNNQSSYSMSGSEHTYTFPLVAALSTNGQHRQLKYQHISNLISEYQDVESEQRALRDKMQSVHNFGWAEAILQKIPQFSTDLLAQNLNTVKAYLSKSTPYVQIEGQNGELTLVIEPQSMSAITISDLYIAGLELNQVSHLPIKASTIMVSPDGITQFPNKGIILPIVNQRELDLTTLVRDFEMYTGVDRNSDRLIRKYIIKFEAKNIDFSDIALEDIKLNVKNLVMKTVIPSSSISLTKISDLKLKDLLSSASIVFEPYQPESEFSDLEMKFPNIDMSHTNKYQLTIHAGDYYLNQDFIVPAGLQLVLEAGTTLSLGSNVSLTGSNGVEIKGTRAEPVTITSIDPLKPYGTFGILGNKKSTSHINYLYQSHGSERWVNGVFFSGGLSIHYNNSVTIKNSVFKNNQADDGVNIKYVPNVLIEATLFQDNYADQIDLDYTNALILNAQFLNTKGGDLNGDGLDLSGSKVIVSETLFNGFRDKGISIGESSEFFVYKSNLIRNVIGAAVKDRSSAYFERVNFSNNDTDIAAYMKKDIFGGGRVNLQNPSRSPDPMSFLFDKKSSLFYVMDKKMNGALDPLMSPQDIPEFFQALKKKDKRKVNIEATYTIEESE